MRSFVLVSILAANLAVGLAACSTQDAATPDGSMSSPDVLGPFDRDVAAADVSILYPLGDRDQLVAASEVGAYGQLLPEHIVPGTPYPLDRTGAAGGYADMRIVSLRLDPCSARGGCSPEIRVIFQPVQVRDGVVSADDGAIHVFYALPADELLLVMKQILALKKAYGAGVEYGDTLGPQPILVASGLSGDFATGLHKLLLAHLGEQRIARITMMLHIFPDQDAWNFVRLERSGDAFVLRPIVNTQHAQQPLFGRSALVDEIGGIDADAATTTPTLPALSALASSSRPLQPTGQITAGFAQAVEVQQPALHNSEDTDCGSCHVAEGARRAGMEIYGLQPTADFTSNRSLGYVRSGKALTNFHAFGYLGTQISVMRRTANESAIVADLMQSAL